ncbi:MAG: esterase/lipase family protein [Mycobacteriales bacterium]
MANPISTGRGLAVELAWTGAHLATYPFGIARERGGRAAERFGLAGMGPAQRGLLHTDLEAAGTPILLVHGVLDNRSVFARLRRGLRRRGFDRIRTVNYPVYTRDVRMAASRLAADVEEYATDTGYEQIHVIGHSLGGLLARYYVQRLEGDARVRTLVTLATPHSGTRLARLAPGGVLRQLTPDSDVIRELAEPAPTCRTRFVALWTGLDEMIRPASGARIEHPDLLATNVEIPGVGHLAMPAEGRVIHAVAEALAFPPTVAGPRAGQSDRDLPGPEGWGYSLSSGA